MIVCRVKRRIKFEERVGDRAVVGKMEGFEYLVTVHDASVDSQDGEKSILSVPQSYLYRG